VTAQLAHAGLERDTGARRRPVEDERDGPSLQRSRCEPVGLQLERAVQECAQLLGRKLVAGEEVTRHQRIVVRAATWNLFHGRDFPPDPRLLTLRSRLLRVTETNATHAQVNRPLLEEFAVVLGRLPWDVGLLQETPPGWLRPLCGATAANGASALTSRNWGHALRALAARLNPDLVASGEGGSNQLLARRPWRIERVERVTIARRPERRRMVLARLRNAGGAEIAVANLHASTGDRADEVLPAAARAVDWSAGVPLLFGGDLNVRPQRRREAFAELEARFGLAPATGAHAIDHLLVRGLAVVDEPRQLRPEEREVEDRATGLALQLSDHSPVVATFEVE
jgi:endonuclease/exonuclease/phosphatase family metal-dependent hydrolase